MKVYALIALCVLAVLATVTESGEVHAVPGDFGYKVEVKHPSHISHDGKGHHQIVEDHGVQEQYIKTGIYPHVDVHYGAEEAHGYEHH